MVSTIVIAMAFGAAGRAVTSREQSKFCILVVILVMAYVKAAGPHV